MKLNISPESMVELRVFLQVYIVAEWSKHEAESIVSVCATEEEAISVVQSYAKAGNKVDGYTISVWQVGPNGNPIGETDYDSAGEPQWSMK